MASDDSIDVPRDSDQEAPQPVPLNAAATWLTAADFDAPHRSETPQRPPGPGLPESVAWFVGVIVLEIFCGIVAMVVCVMGYALTLPADEQSQLFESFRDPDAMESLQRTLQTPLLVVGQLLFLVTAIGLVKLRLGRNATRRLSLSAIPVRHFVLMLCLILPVGVISNTVYAVSEPVWQKLCQMVPALRSLDSMNTMTMIPEIAGEISIPLLLLALAVVPAIAEELFFRGLIGRGLTARWGLPAGVLLTSVLFAAAHIHPLHAVAVIPLGIAIHFVYLATRSFWAPMAFHFLNNAISVVAIKAQSRSEEVEWIPAIFRAEVEFTPTMLVLAFASALAVGMLMWQMRVRYLLPDGRTWDPGHESVERPPITADAFRSCTPATVLLTCAAAFSVLAFFSTFVHASMSSN